MYMATSVTTTHLSKNSLDSSAITESSTEFNKNVAGVAAHQEHLHFSCPHCAKAYYTLETEFFSDEDEQSNQNNQNNLESMLRPTTQLFSCENCHKDFLVEWENELQMSSAEPVVQMEEVDFVATVEPPLLVEAKRAIHKKDFISRENLYKENSYRDLAAKEEKTLGVFLFEVFKHSLKVKYLPFYLGLVCFFLGLIFAHMRNAIGLAAVLMLLQMAFSYLFEPKS